MLRSKAGKSARNWLASMALLAAAGCAPAAMEGAMAPGGVMLSDPNVAAIASASNQFEIQTSQVALQRSQNQQVRQFAQHMITDHTALEQRMQQLLSAKGMAPQDNEISTQLKTNTAATVQSLSARSGADLDRAYMQAQVASHQWTLTSLDNTLIPATRDRDMRAMLQGQARPSVAQHLQQGQQIQSSLGGM